MRRPLLLMVLFGAGAACAQVEVDECEAPNVLIVLDRSGSMLEDNKWGQAVDALTQVTRTFESRLRFGLLVFPSIGRCGVSRLAALRSEVAPRNAMRVQGELGRARPDRGGATPIDAALTVSREYLIDLRDEGRRSFVVLVTDGEETCDGNPRDAASRVSGTGFPLFVVGFGGGVDRATLQNMAERGGTGMAYQARDGGELFAAMQAIADRAGEELCDAKDNDCDGRVDEGLPERPCETECGTGREVCVDGRYSGCHGGDIPTETCDGTDEDCDLRTDEDCQDPEVPPEEEVCDGVDNDEDRFIDEGTDSECDVECHRGRRVCVEGSYVECSARPVTGEMCNGLDDDCDGRTDEDAECVGLEICEGGRCLPPCPFNECPEYFFCEEDGYCHPIPCEPACDDDALCVAQTCRQMCVVDRDCPAEHICERRLCQPGMRPGTGVPEVPTVRERRDAGAGDAAVAEDESAGSCDCGASGSVAYVGAYVDAHGWLFGVLAIGRRRRKLRQ